DHDRHARLEERLADDELAARRELHDDPAVGPALVHMAPGVLGPTAPPAVVMPAPRPVASIPPPAHACGEKVTESARSRFTRVTVSALPSKAGGSGPKAPWGKKLRGPSARGQTRRKRRTVRPEPAAPSIRPATRISSASSSKANACTPRTLMKSSFGTTTSFATISSRIAASEPISPHAKPSTMNGPRTNQLVAPTSFITSISRRRAKIDSRIVFPIIR